MPLREFKETPLLDGYKVINYVEALDPLPSIHGLHAIRLVTVEPGEESAPLSCTLNRHFIDECPSYEALSYTWKKATFTHPLILNGAEFLITENVETALRHLRYTDKPRRMWIDSICIDQRNVIEKNAQVRLMNSIYRKASRVISWIGKADEDEDNSAGRHVDVDLAFELARDIEKAGAEKYAEVVAKHSELAIFSLTVLTDRSYFRRQWVIQEVSLAKEVLIMCGNHIITWNAIAAAAEGMAQNGQDWRATLLFSGSNKIFDLFGIRAMEFCRATGDEGHFSNDLVEILRTSRGREVTDPRDMIYSLLGICGPNSMPVEIDYRKPVVRLYKEFARDAILRSRNLDFLRLCDHWSRDEGLPSWSPNWTYIWAGSWQIRSLGYKGWPPTEGRIIPHSDDVVFSDELDHLTVKGHLIDCIAQCQDMATMPLLPDNSISDDDVYTELKTTLTISERLCTARARKGQSFDSRRAEFIQSLFACFTDGAETDFTEADFTIWYENIMSSSIPDLSEKERAFWRQYCLKLLRFLADARFFVTVGAIIGLAERACKFELGDLICSFKGGSAESTFLIRAIEPRYTLINGCYLHFTPTELAAHEELVEDLNRGTLETKFYTLE